MRKIVLGLFFLTFIFSAYCEDFPKPYGWVNDFAGVISSQYKDKITYLVEELEAKTSAEVIIVTKESIAPYDEKEFSRLLFDNWKPGKKGKDNGVLILLAVKERRWRIETGYGLESILPDGLCGEIGRNYLVPEFKKGDYGKGFYNAATAIAKIIADNAGVKLNNLNGVELKNTANTKTNIPWPISVFVLLFFYLWNLPWPIYIGLPFTLLFAVVFFSFSPLAGISIIIGYIASMITRFLYWSKLPPNERKNFFATQTYGGLISIGNSGSTGSSSGGFGGGGFGGGGGGCGGGGGAGGGF